MTEFTPTYGEGPVPVQRMADDNNDCGMYSIVDPNNNQTGANIPLPAEFWYAPVDGWPAINMKNYIPPPPLTPCWLCQGLPNGPNDTSFFEPCGCGPCHRLCHKNWRQQWILPKNYFSCLNCMQNYDIQRVDQKFDPASLEESEIRSTVRLRLALFWLALLTALVVSVVVWALIGWASEKEDKRIPIGISYVLTSVAEGVPNANTTKLWKERFLDPDVATWPYYMVFGILITSISIILLFVCNAIYEACCQDDEDKLREPYRDSQTQSCSQTCHCQGNDCNTCCLYCYVPRCPSGGGGDGCCRQGDPQMCDGLCDAVWCHCSRLNCDCNGETCSCPDCGDCNCSGGSDCNCSGGGGGDGAALIPIICVVIIIVAVAVVVSSIFIIAYFSAQRLERYQAWLSKMLYERQLELSNKMVVIGKGESVLKFDQV